MTENDSLTDIITIIKNKMLFRLSHLYNSHTHKRKIILILLYLVGMVEWLARPRVELSSGAKDENMMTMNYYGGGGERGNCSVKTGLSPHKNNGVCVWCGAVRCGPLTVLVEQQHQVFPVEGVDGEQQCRTLPRPEAQRDVLSSQRHVGVDERRPAAPVPAQDVELLERVGDGRGGPEAGRHLWKV